MKRTILICSFSLLVLVLDGCGGTQTTSKTAKDVAAEGGSPTGEGGFKVAPKRDITTEAKDAYLDAIKNYMAVKKTGITSANCADHAAIFARLYNNYPKLPEAKFNEGVVWEECGNMPKAEEIYRHLLDKEPNFGPALNNLGAMAFKQGNVDMALTYFKRAAEHMNSEGFANLALLQRERALRGGGQNVADAINNVHQALAVDAFNMGAYATMALILYDHAETRSQLDMARLICVQATKVNDQYAPIYNILGLILLRMGKVTSALAEFRKAVTVDNNFMEAHMNIGAVTLSFRDYKSAEEAFAKVLSLNPHKKMKIEALIGLGVAYRGQRRFSEALKKYQEAQTMDPANLEVSYNMGILAQDYTFDGSNPAAGVASLKTAMNHLQRYAASGKDAEKVRDANKRIKNITEMMPLLQEQLRATPQVPPAKGR